MRTGSSLIAQLEKCGLSAKLAEEHAEISADVGGSRAVRYEIARAYHANDQAQLPEADAALRWLVTEPGKIVSVGELVDLVDETTGEVLVTGKPGAVIDDPCLVVAFQVGESRDPIEPDDDMGLVSMGLAKFLGKPFRTGHVVAKDGQAAFVRKSEVFEPASHAALLGRIKAAVSRPRIACPGDWCGACRQNVHCDSWKARATTALTVFTSEMQPAGKDAPVLDITNENAGELAVRLEFVKKASKIAEEQLKAFIRRGGTCIKNGKRMCLDSRDGKKTASVEALEAAGLSQYVKQGSAFETTVWHKAEPALAARRR
jgi:hypothetical protein